MTGKNEDYRVGDRIQKTERRGTDDRIYPGTRGFVTAVSGFGGKAYFSTRVMPSNVTGATMYFKYSSSTIFSACSIREP